MQQINDLIDGFGRFRAKYFGERGIAPPAEGRNPRFLVVACSDARTDPAILFDAAPGDLFVVRNVANLVPPYEIDHTRHGVSAALEFGVKVLKVRHIVVLGHTDCRGIQALVSGSEGEFVSRWMQIAEPARRRTIARLPDASSDELCQACEREAIAGSVDNLKSFPWINRQVVNGDLFVHGWHIDIASNILFQHDPHSDRFIPISPGSVPDPSERSGRGMTRSLRDPSE